jgi:hypothetical protein
MKCSGLNFLEQQKPFLEKKSSDEPLEERTIVTEEPFKKKQPLRCEAPSSGIG